MSGQYRNIRVFVKRGRKWQQILVQRKKVTSAYSPAFRHFSERACRSRNVGIYVGRSTAETASWSHRAGP